MPARRRAFTLVELLVVIGIITVLVALLMPALSKVRKQAQEVHCAANLRSIGQAMTMYTQAYGYYPGLMAWDGTTRNYYAIWPTRLRTMMGGETGAFNCPAQPDRCRWVRGRTPTTAETAATAKETAFGYEVGEPLLGLFTYFGYGYNRFQQDAGVAPDRSLGTIVYMPRPNPPVGGEVRASRVRRPEDMIAVADSTPDGWYDMSVTGDADAPREYPGNVHRGGANVLFCDGHVNWRTQQYLVPRPGDPYYVPAVRSWNNDQSYP